MLESRAGSILGRGATVVSAHVLAGVVCGAFWPAGARAVPTIDAANDQPTLQEVVVTAQKREERLQDVPVAVTAISSDTLLVRNQVSLEDYVRDVPGFTMNYGGNGLNTLVIRGITTGGIVNSTVGVTIDDVPFGSSLGVTFGGVTPPDLDPADLASIEVLRGPQGTLYGASSLGGLLKYVTTDPSLTEVKGRVEVGVDGVTDGGTGFVYRGSVDLPAIPNVLGFSLSAFDRRDAGFIDDPTHGFSNVNQVEVKGGRGALLWRPDDAISLKVTALLQQTDANGQNFINTNGTLTTSGGLNQTGLLGTGPYEMKSQLYAATLTDNFGAVTLTSVTGYNINEYDAIGQFGAFNSLAEAIFGVNGAALSNAFENKKFSEEIRLASNSTGAFTWLLGAFYSHDDTSSVQSIPAIDPASGTSVGILDNSVFPDQLSEIAGFGDLTVHFTDRFNVQLGGRESEDRQTYNETDSGALLGGTSVVPTEHTRDSSFTYLVTPQYKFSPDLMTYARVATGYRVGGPNPSAALFGFPTTFEPDKTTNYELGLKGELLDRRCTFDADIYYINWNNIQIQETNPATQFVYFTNAEKASSKGAELSLQARPSQGLTLSMTAAYTDAILGRDLPGGAYGLQGNELPYSSHFVGSLNADQEFRLSAGITGFAGLSSNYTGSRFGSFAPAPPPTAVRPEFPSYGLLALRAGVKMDRWTARIYVDNVTNKIAVLSATSLTSNQAANAPWTGAVTTPRTIGLSLTALF